MYVLDFNLHFPSLTRSPIACNHSTEAPREALDIPLDAHILPGCGKRLNCLLPVVCVAPEHEIEALVTTVVCQRYVLDITLPVVGVSLSTSGTTAKIILGWAEDDRDDSVGTFLLGWIINTLTMFLQACHTHCLRSWE